LKSTSAQQQQLSCGKSNDRAGNWFIQSTIASCCVKWGQ